MGCGCPCLHTLASWQNWLWSFGGGGANLTPLPIEQPHPCICMHHTPYTWHLASQLCKLWELWELCGPQLTLHRASLLVVAS